MCEVHRSYGITLMSESAHLNFYQAGWQIETVWKVATLYLLFRALAYFYGMNETQCEHKNVACS